MLQSDLAAEMIRLEQARRLRDVERLRLRRAAGCGDV